MFASSDGSRAKRRGIVLVVVLGMLGLMALIGVTFATFAGQSLIASRNFGQGVARPQGETLMDYALAQLINDTSNPVSALRGHSLLRDMYGNDSVYRGSNPTVNPAAESGGLVTSVYNSGSLVPLQFTGFAPRTGSTSSPSPTPFYNQVQYTTNIPTTGQYYGLDFTRWIVKFQGTPANGGNTNFDVPKNGNALQTFEVLEDDASGAVHQFTLSNSLTNPTVDPYNNSANPPPLVPDDWSTFTYVDANYVSPQSNNGYGVVAQNGGTYLFNKAWASMARSWHPNGSFVLDGRYMRAFNGPGVTQPYGNVYPYNLAALANFRVTGFDPDSQGMDEDYDACDLENWFLAIQSADGQVVVPSFHRPGILTSGDWTSTNAQNIAKILRPRQADNSPLFPPDPSVADSTGRLTYDIDNDGDGVTDSVWLDLGYPVQRDPGGKIYKPLFAFMVLGLNGRLPLNTVGNLQSRANADVTNNGAETPNLPLSTGQVPYPGVSNDGTVGAYLSASNNNLFIGPTPTSSQTYLDAPLWDHASHLGYSVNEINPKFALQNAPSNVYASASTLGNTASPISPNFNGTNFSQMDDAGVSVALTQMRNILAGTILTDLPRPYPPSKLPVNSNNAASANADANVVIVDGQAWVLPNNVADLNDLNQTGSQPGTPYPVARLLTAVPGRWGETSGVQANNLLPAAGSLAFAGLSYPGLIYSNPVRAGRSTYINGSNDFMDDDFDSIDPVLASYAQATLYYREPTTPVTPPQTTTIGLAARTLPEQVDSFDTIGQRAVASERIRQFVTPIDPSGTGRVVGFMNRPNNDYDYGNGYDTRGRAGYFRYYRPAGMPQDIRYPYGGPGSSYSYSNSPVGGPVDHRFLMPQLFPAGSTFPLTAAATGASDIHNNRYHGFQAMLSPEIAGTITPQAIAVFGAMLYDWDNAITTGMANIPTGYPTTTSSPQMPLPAAPPLGMTTNPFVNNFAPTINPFAPQTAPPQAFNSNPISTSINSSSGPNLGLAGNPQTGTSTYPILYGNYQSNTDSQPFGSPVVNGYLGGSLNKDEADEMNLYTANRYDTPYGPSDLEWLYRLQDVDGAALDSRLSQLAPVSFLNPADGLTRRRLFSTDSWELTGFVYANDNPAPYAGVAYGAQTDHDFTFNSRFMPTASPSLEIMNQVSANALNSSSGNLANPFTTEYLPNPTFPGISSTNAGLGYGSVTPNSSSGTLSLPTAVNTSSMNGFPLGLFDKPQIIPVSTQYGVVVPSGGNSMVQVQTPSLAHRDRKINLNMPLPISNDPAEPVRQKWCRETYQMLKAILPPASVDTPEELAALSQYVVNIVDSRDPDCTMTRFVNTDLIMTDALTRTASTIPSATLDTTWNVTPPGVRFSTPADSPALQSTVTVNGMPQTVHHYPYDPSLYSPDAVSPFLIQHGMEYNPIALNEALGFQIAGSANRGLYIEMVNTLTEEQNNNVSNNNSSAISLQGWDIVMAPDAYGWGRPDPISGDVNPIAYPPLIPGPLMATMQPANMIAPLNVAQRYAFGAGTTIRAINNATPTAFVVGQAPTGGLSGTVATLNVTLPATFQLPTIPAGKGQYFWIYLRRPANPFDTAALAPTAPNREMVVVDAIRFAFNDTGTTSPYNEVFSARRLQPYRGGHLVPTATTATAPPMTGPAAGVTTICPPSPASAYGYSEQMSPLLAVTSTVTNTGNTKPFNQSIGSLTGNPTDDHWAHLPFLDRDFTSVAELLMVPGCPPGLFTKQFVEEPYPGNVVGETIVTTITKPMAPSTTTTTTTTVTYNGTYATGSDDGNLVAPITTPIVYPAYTTGNTYPYTVTATSPTVTTVTTTTNPVGGRKDFNKNAVSYTGPPAVTIAPTPVAPTFPYLPDNFYYTAPSVSPGSSGTFPTGYSHLTTEIGGWTGNGWHKMMEFFEVPSSANGAIGTADGGNNFDWARADIKPGLLNLNLIIDEEVFAGLFDDPRLNERLAAYSAPGSTALPQVVTQIDANGYASTHYPIFAQSSLNQLNSPPMDVNNYPNNSPTSVGINFGRGYVVRDPDSQDYFQPTLGQTTFPYQQLHGLKAAFSDFLKLRHGGSGYLFAHGAGPTGSGDFIHNTIPASQPIASERPYRSMSYPDINYTIMRPASLPPSPVDTANPIRYTPTSPPLPDALKNLFTYQTNTPTVPAGNMTSYFQLNPFVAPMNLKAGDPVPAPFQYTADPGVKNPYLAIQYVFPTNPRAAANQPPPYYPALPTGYPANAFPGPPYPAFPYAAQPSAGPPKPQAAPFPPPIPPTPSRRLIQIPDIDTSTARAPAYPSSNASLSSSVDGTLAGNYSVNRPVTTLMLFSGGVNPPTLVPQTRAVFLPNNNTPQPSTTYAPNDPMATIVVAGANNYLGAGSVAQSTGLPPTNDYRQHPLYRTEMLQKIMNLSTVRTHQFAVWITIGFFEVVKPGTTELGVPDVLGQELGLTAGKNVRFRSFFTLDRTKATGFNPYYPGNFRDVVTYRRRIE